MNRRNKKDVLNFITRLKWRGKGMENVYSMNQTL